MKCCIHGRFYLGAYLGNELAVQVLSDGRVSFQEGPVGPGPFVLFHLLTSLRELAACSGVRCLQPTLKRQVADLCYVAAWLGEFFLKYDSVSYDQVQCHLALPGASRVNLCTEFIYKVKLFAIDIISFPEIIDMQKTEGTENKKKEIDDSP